MSERQSNLDTSFTSLVEENEKSNGAPGQSERLDGDETQLKKTIVVDDFDLLEAFFQETREHLDTIEEKILKLEQANDVEIVGEIFRYMHTMKGTASFFLLTVTY